MLPLLNKFFLLLLLLLLLLLESECFHYLFSPTYDSLVNDPVKTTRRLSESEAEVPTNNTVRNVCLRF